ncbi:uncharacterized protein LODBEIA_P25800 [Lodderomyces beijingensis]|uniref:tRNA-splicing endonuclease subunit Sen15 domain-containing protein n=1 Tax=Lodderomyces beijingensis TaxID=1775926 RepID=A0ABP0ZN76_9ASCO
MTKEFTTILSDQVKLNLIHYNLWTQVQVHNDHILSGFPPQKLASTDPENKTEWIACKRLLNTKLSVQEINSWFEEIKAITSAKDGESSAKSRSDKVEDASERLKSLDLQNMTETDAKVTNGGVSSTDQDPRWAKMENVNGKGRVDRVTVALVNDDGTIVYYFIYDGITKPRQN